MTAQIRRVPMWIRVAGLVMAAGLAMGLALPGSAAASSSPAKPSACTGTPVRAPVATSFPSRRKKGSTDRASCPEHVPGVSGARAPGLARAKEGLRCTGIPGHGAGDRSFPVKVKTGSSASPQTKSWYSAVVFFVILGLLLLANDLTKK